MMQAMTQMRDPMSRDVHTFMSGAVFGSDTLFKALVLARSPSLSVHLPT